MGREVRKVPSDWDRWKHSSQPLFDGFNEAIAHWNEHSSNWQKGLYLKSIGSQWIPIPDEYKHYSYEEWDMDRPDPADYMPDWDKSERTHYQMYENTTEGTPLSPAFATEDELIDYLVDNKVSAFASDTRDREFWTNIVKRDTGSSD